MNKKILILGPAGQYNHLIYRKVLELGHEGILVSLDSYKINEKFDSIIIGGGPARLTKKSKEIKIFKEILKFNKPILGICLGFQIISLFFDGEIKPVNPEFGPQRIFLKENNVILEGVPKEFIAWESHNDSLIKIPKIFKILAYSKINKAEIIKHKFKKIYGIQFHPEVEHTEYGSLILKNFIEKI